MISKLRELGALRVDEFVCIWEVDVYGLLCLNRLQPTQQHAFLTFVEREADTEVKTRRVLAQADAVRRLPAMTNVLFQQMASAVKSHRTALVKQVGAIFQFVIPDRESSSWT